MSRFWALVLVASVLGPLLALSPGCASKNKKDSNTAATEKTNQPEAMPIDKSRCQPSGKKVVELDVNGDKKPDVWKFYVKSLENGTTVDALSCKEVDLNYDGKIDAWYYYDASSNVAHEEFDLDFDGHIDLQTFRQQGKIVRQELDTNFDGKPDVWKFYENEKLVRVERSSKANGKVDVWEYYEGGKLDRIGYDTTGSGRVDRWERAPEEAPNKDKEQVAQPAANTTPSPTKPPQAAPRAVSPEPSGK